MLIIFGTSTSFASSSSTPPTPLYYVGYDGNDTVYMTSGISLGTTSLICFNNINVYGYMLPSVHNPIDVF